MLRGWFIYSSFLWRGFVDYFRLCVWEGAKIIRGLRGGSTMGCDIVLLCNWGFVTGSVGREGARKNQKAILLLVILVFFFCLVL